MCVSSAVCLLLDSESCNLGSPLDPLHLEQRRPQRPEGVPREVYMRMEYVTSSNSTSENDLNGVKLRNKMKRQRHRDGGCEVENEKRCTRKRRMSG